jgi:hypothetical protein
VASASRWQRASACSVFQFHRHPSGIRTALKFGAHLLNATPQGHDLALGRKLKSVAHNVLYIRSHSYKLPIMDGEKLQRWQAAALFKALQSHVGYLYRLRERMAQVGFVPSDPCTSEFARLTTRSRLCTSRCITWRAAEAGSVQRITQRIQISSKGVSIRASAVRLTL